MAGCSGSDGNGDAAASAEGTAIDGSEPTATTAPTPTSEPTVAPTPTAEPTVTPTATPEPSPEAEVIEAWERYLRLSIEARGKDPSPEALDFDSYVIGGAQEALDPGHRRRAGCMGRYVDGSMHLACNHRCELRDDGAGVVEDLHR